MQQRICRSVGKHEERHITTMSALMTIAMVVLLLLSLTLVFVSVARADIEVEGRNFTKDGGWVTYNGTIHSGGYEKETTKIMVFEGEKIYFKNATTGTQDVIITGPYDDDADTKSGCKDFPPVKAGTSWDCTEDNYYFKVWEVSNPDIGGWFGADDHFFTLELEKEEVQESENFNLTLKKNNKRGGVMKLTIEDSEGYSIMNESGTDIYEIRIEYKNETEFFGFFQDQDPVGGINITDNKLVFNASELAMEEGTYKIILEDCATEVEKKEDIKVEKIYLKVECDEEVVKGEDIVIIIKSSFYEKEVNVTVEGIPKWEDKKTLTLDEEGKKKVKISTENEDCGTYKVTVEVCGYIETKYVKVKKSGTSLEVPENATVGDIVHIEGTSDFGDFTVFLIDDVFKKEARISGDKFEWDWDTSGELDGYCEIEVFILSEHATDTFSVGDHVSEDWQRGEGVDASATIFLLLPEFSMTVSKNIAKGDDVVISGTVIGADHVYVIVMNHKGEVMFPPDGTTDVIKARTTSVEGGEWEENIGELDSGRYTVIALYEGKDGVTDAINDNDEWVAGDGSKTLEQRVAILMDALTSAGSDDLFEKADFSVSTPKVILEVPEIVEIGDELSVKAETNIKAGAKAFISLFQNTSSNNLKKTFTLVENSCVSTNINTSGLQPGKYNVAVDVSGRASDEKEVTLVEKKGVMEEGKEEIAQNESVTEPGPAPEAAKDTNETVGEGEFLNETREGGEEAQKKSTGTCMRFDYCCCRGEFYFGCGEAQAALTPAPFIRA